MAADAEARLQHLIEAAGDAVLTSMPSSELELLSQGASAPPETQWFPEVLRRIDPASPRYRVTIPPEWPGGPFTVSVDGQLCNLTPPPGAVCGSQLTFVMPACSPPSSPLPEDEPITPTPGAMLVPWDDPPPPSVLRPVPITATPVEHAAPSLPASSFQESFPSPLASLLTPTPAAAAKPRARNRRGGRRGRTPSLSLGY
jgi:hypothetical protein